jgi:hypothetical protein
MIECFHRDAIGAVALKQLNATLHRREPRRLAASDDRARMRIEREHHQLIFAVTRAKRSVGDDRLMPTMHAVEISDDDDRRS